MFTRNTPQKILESWKQIAGYLERSERTVRRWEACEGLPVHRRGHEKQDTVFAYRHEIDVWSRSRTKCPGAELIDDAEGLPRSNLPIMLISSSTTRSPGRCTATSPVLAQAIAISCMPPFTLGPRSPDSARGSNIAGPSNTCSIGSPRTAPHRTSNLASPASRSSKRSPSFTLKYNTGQVSWLARMPGPPTCSHYSGVTASGRSHTSSSTGTTNNPRNPYSRQKAKELPDAPTPCPERSRTGLDSEMWSIRAKLAPLPAPTTNSSPATATTPASSKSNASKKSSPSPRSIYSRNNCDDNSNQR